MRPSVDHHVPDAGPVLSEAELPDLARSVFLVAQVVADVLVVVVIVVIVVAAVTDALAVVPAVDNQLSAVAHRDHRRTDQGAV